MKSKQFVVASAAAAMMLPVSALAEGGGGGEWYWRLGAGISLPEDVDQDIANSSLISNGLEPISQSTKIDTGFNLGGGIGYVLNKSWRVEGELRYVSADLGNTRQTSLAGPVPGGPVSGSGDATALAVLANAILDINISGSKLYPYFGGGVGYADVSLDGAGDDGGSAFAYQFFIGLNYKMEKSSWLSFQATYLDTGDVDYDPTGFGTGSSLTAGEVDFTTTDLTISINRKFN